MLKDSLKENVDVAAKIREFTKKFEELQKTISSVNVKSNSEVSRQRIKRITETLRAITKTLSSQIKKFDEINVKFQTVKAERKRLFEETIEKLNQGIGEFCKFSFDSPILGILEIVNVAEPYLGDIIFYWNTIENPYNRISEMKPNYISSLALLLAIIKLKKQKFVILNEAVKCMTVGLETFLNRQNYVQVVLLTSQLTYDDANYSILPKLQSFAVTRIN